MSYVDLNGKDWVVVEAGTINVVKAYKHWKTAKNKASALGEHEVMSKEFYFDKCSEEVTVQSAYDGADVTIRRSQLGGACDPSTEQFWSM